MKIETSEQLGDMSTKGLAKPTFEYLRSKIIGWQAHFSCFDLVSVQCLEYNFERECRYRFSGKPISTYMSLTLARMCGEWRNGVMTVWTYWRNGAMAVLA